MILVGIDDTDTLESPGTNQLARAIVARVCDRFRCVSIVRHQLLDDPRVPYTSKNGSASICLEPRGGFDRTAFIAEVRDVMRDRFVEGSDPGLCVCNTEVPHEVRAFGRRCQRELIAQHEARDLAARQGLWLEGLGGTEGGVIGALAAIGLIADRSDGRVVQHGEWPDDLEGEQSTAMLAARGVTVVNESSGAALHDARVNVGKRLRPNLRNGQVVLFVESRPGQPVWQALKRL